MFNARLVAIFHFLRYRGDGPVISKPKFPPLVAAYDFAREITEPEALDELLADPDEMRMQALVIRERILGPAHPDTSYYIRYRGAVYADAGKFRRCIDLWNYALDMQQNMLEPLNPMTQSSLFSFTELFSFMVGEEGRQTTRGRRVPPVQREELLRVFKKAVSVCCQRGSDRYARISFRSRSRSFVYCCGEILFAGHGGEKRQTDVGQDAGLRARLDVFEQSPRHYPALGMLVDARDSGGGQRRVRRFAQADLRVSPNKGQRQAG